MARKRPNNDGSISRYKNMWRGQYTDPMTHKQRAVYGKTQAECKAKLDAKLAEIKSGAYVAPNKITVGGWLDLWFEKYYCNSVKTNTAATTSINIRTVLKPALGHILLQKLTAEEIEEFFRHQQEGNAAGSTMRRYLTILRQALSKAVKLKHIPRNPAADVTLPKVEKAEIQFLTRDEQELFLAVIPATTGGRALRFLLGTGLRVSEMCGLQWRDIQEDGLHIERVYMTIKDPQNDGYINVTPSPKTTAGKRIIPLTPTIQNLLEEQRRVQIAERLKAGSAWEGAEPGKGSGYVFASKTGKPADRNNMNRTLHSILKKAGLPSRGVHALRHTFATNWIQTGNDVVALSRILGHTDPSFTYRTYCHPEQRSMVKGMADMESFLQVK